MYGSDNTLLIMNDRVSEQEGPRGVDNERGSKGPDQVFV